MAQRIRSLNFVLETSAWQRCCTDGSRAVEKVEEYALYSLGADGIDGHVCQCSHPQSFGKNCEYLLGAGQTFDDALKWQQRLHIAHPTAGANVRRDDLLREMDMSLALTVFGLARDL